MHGLLSVFEKTNTLRLSRIRSRVLYVKGTTLRQVKRMKIPKAFTNSFPFPRLEKQFEIRTVFSKVWHRQTLPELSLRNLFHVSMSEK